jgi:hypothetical protein
MALTKTINQGHCSFSLILLSWMLMNFYGYLLPPAGGDQILRIAK